MLGYETQRGGELGDLPPFPLQGMPGNFPPYPLTPQSMGIPPWGMFMNGAMPSASVPMPLSGIPGSTYNSVTPTSGVEAKTVAAGVDKLPLETINAPICPKVEINGGTPVSPPPTRERFSYTRYQLELLSGIYGKIRYPNSMQKQLIAKRVGITRDQVKIWFQNRRRKDIVGKKSTIPDPTADGKRMVPDTVMASVLNELLGYENDPKGKKVAKAQKSFEKKVAKKRSRDDSESNDSDLASKRFKTCLDSPEDVPIYYASEPSPVSFDSFSSAASPYSNSSQHDSHEPVVVVGKAVPRSSISPQNTADIPRLPSVLPNVANPSNNTVEIVFHPAPYSVTGEQLDKPSPPNRIAPGVCLNPNLPQRPPSLESPALDQSAEEASTTDDGLQLTKCTLPEERKPPVEKPISPKDVPPNRVAPPSEPIKFNPKIAAVHSITPPSVTIALSKEQILSGDLPHVSPSSSHSSSAHSVVTTSALPMPLQSFTPLYAPEPEHFSWHKVGPPVSCPEKLAPPAPPPHPPTMPTNFPDLNMFFPPSYPYCGPPPPPLYHENGGSNFDKIMPYMMSGFPSFPSPYDPGLLAKNLNNNNKEMENNNISSILKDAYPPAFMIPPFKQNSPGFSEAHSSSASAGATNKVTYL